MTDNMRDEVTVDDVMLDLLHLMAATTTTTTTTMLDKTRMGDGVLDLLGKMAMATTTTMLPDPRLGKVTRGNVVRLDGMQGEMVSAGDLTRD